MKLRCHQKGKERRFVSFRRGGIHGRRRNSKDEITLRGIRESVVRTRQLGPNRDSPGRARELTRKFQIELAKLEGRAFNEMRSSTAMPKPCLRSRLFFFFLAAILLHPFISSPHIFFYFLIFLSLLPRIQMRINIKHLFIAPRNLSLVSFACTAHVLRVDFEFIRSF